MLCDQNAHRIGPARLQLLIRDFSRTSSAYPIQSLPPKSLKAMLPVISCEGSEIERPRKATLLRNYAVTTERFRLGLNLLGFLLLGSAFGCSNQRCNCPDD